MSELSQSTRNSGGDMFRLGYRTRRRLLRGIFVSLLSLEVARMRSTTVCRMSRFSTGRQVMRCRSTPRSVADAGRTPAKLGIARVDREGGLRRAGPPRGLDGRPNPLSLRFGWLPAPGVAEFDSSISVAMAASNEAWSRWVNIGSGTDGEGSLSKSLTENQRVGTHTLSGRP